jgi:hypothetical protein
VLQRSGLVANAIQGDGGNISIMAEGFLPSRESVISASSEFGLEGSIEIETPETNVGGGLVELPERLVGAEVNLSDRCALMLSGDVSSFFQNGDGGVPIWSRVNYVPSVFLGDEDREEWGWSSFIDLKYGMPQDAVAELGQVGEIREMFLGFQKYLYEPVEVAG